eukprot:jgi/Mesen1/189/ME1136685C07691
MDIFRGHCVLTMRHLGLPAVAVLPLPLQSPLPLPLPSDPAAPMPSVPAPVLGQAAPRMEPQPSGLGASSSGSAVAAGATAAVAVAAAAPAMWMVPLPGGATALVPGVNQDYETSTLRLAVSSPATAGDELSTCKK